MKKKMKKFCSIIAMLAIVAMIMPSLSTEVFAGDSGPGYPGYGFCKPVDFVSDVYWEYCEFYFVVIDSDKHVVMKWNDDYTGKVEGIDSLEIPETVKDGSLVYTITKLDGIQNGTFYSLFNPDSSITKVTIPKTVTVIGNKVFLNCAKLKNINLPDSLNEIGELAFAGCSGLESINIPADLKKIGQNAFSGSGVQNVVIPSSVTEIGTDAFCNCNNLKTVTILMDNPPVFPFENSDAITDIYVNIDSAANYRTAWASVQDKIKGIAKVDFDMKGHGAQISSMSNLVEGSKITKPADPTAPDYVFGGWYTDSDCQSEYDFNAPITKNLILYAKWTKKGEPSPEPSPKPSPEPKFEDPTVTFKDVAKGKWYSKVDGPIAYVVAYGIMNGTGDGKTFDPEGDCTREMFVQILYNSEGEPGAGSSNPFKDVKNGKWYYDAVTWALANDVTKGTSADTFGIGGKVTREQLAQFLMNYAKKRGYDTSARTDISKFPDNAKVSSWAKEAIFWANANGIVNGKAKNGANYLDPKGNATRAEVAQMIMNFQKKFGR